MKTSSSHSSTIVANRISSNDHEQSKLSSITSGDPEWQKNTIRVCGNWSEQLSSKGKVYFYNCATEVSQWQKPLEWKLPDMTQDELGKIICDRKRNATKRSCSSFHQTDKVKSLLQDNSSPKRQRYSGTKNNADLIKVEENSYIRLGQLNSPRKIERSGKKIQSAISIFSLNIVHDSMQRTIGTARDTFIPVMNSTALTLAICDTVQVNRTSSDENVDFQSTKIISGRMLANTDKSTNPEKIGRLSAIPQTHVGVPPKASDILISHPTRSPLLMTASSGQLSSSDPQSSTSRSSSPFLSRNETTLTPQHRPSSVCPNRFQPDLSVSNNCSLPSFKSDRRSHSDKKSASPQRTSPIKPDQVLRNLVSVLSHVVDKRDRLPLDNASSTNDLTSPVNSASRSQPLVANLLSTFLGTHKRLVDCRMASQTSPASNRVSLTGSDKIKNDRTPTCPPSSDGTSIMSSCPRSSPSPASTASDFRNHPQKWHSPLDLGTASNASQPHPRCHSGEDGGIVIPPSTCTSDFRISVSLDTPEMLRFVDPHLLVGFQHAIADTIEIEAQSLLRNFDRLHSVLYSELSGELKKLRALVSISETKLKIHQQRKESLQELMDAIESKKALPLISSPNAPI